MKRAQFKKPYSFRQKGNEVQALFNTKVNETLAQVESDAATVESGPSATLAMQRVLEAKAKKRAHGARIREVERGALVLSTTGGMARECTVFYKRLADRLADKCKNNLLPRDDLVEMSILFCTTKVSHQGITGISTLDHCSGSSGYTTSFQ